MLVPLTLSGRRTAQNVQKHYQSHKQNQMSRHFQENNSKDLGQANFSRKTCLDTTVYWIYTDIQKAHKQNQEIVYRLIYRA